MAQELHCKYADLTLWNQNGIAANVCLDHYKLGRNGGDYPEGAASKKLCRNGFTTYMQAGPEPSLIYAFLVNEAEDVVVDEQRRLEERDELVEGLCATSSIVSATVESGVQKHLEPMSHVLPSEEASALIQ
uniref:Uncharacterized protein n=1 Tax=Oryza glumipatula TaxID=40148 RepID=A0A0E0BNR2_9ORYZ